MGRTTQKALWLANRLRAMSAFEIAYRIRQSAFRAAAKRKSFSAGHEQAAADLPHLPGLLKALRGFSGNPQFAKLVRQNSVRVMNEPFMALGKTWPRRTDDLRWHLDPESGALWPQNKFCFAIDFRHRNGLGDAKYVWQYNKLQHLHWVAVHAALDDDADTGTFCIEEIESCLRANPPFNGINWASGVECSHRILAFVLAATFVPEKYWPREARQRLNAGLESHGYWLEKNLSLHSSANNHLIVELAGLFLIGAAAAHLPEASRWRRFAQTRLEKECLLQFAADGGSCEQSPTYGAWSLEWLAICASIAEVQGTPFATEAKTRMGIAADAIATLMDQGGNLPRIGDDDDATVLSFTGDRRSWLHSVCGVARHASLPASEAADAEAPIELLSVFGFSAPKNRPYQGLRHLAQTGLSILRKQQAGAETMVVFDHGPLGYLSIAAHGHADALSIWLHRGDRPVLVDAGTYSYGSDAKARDYFRGTSAHNTLTVRGENSSRISGAFNWSKRARCKVLTVEPARMAVSAQHDGYSPTLHNRGIRMDETSVVVRDSLQGRMSGDTVDIRFLLAPDLEAYSVNGAIEVRADDKILMRVSTQGPLQWAWQETAGWPRHGWYSPSLGQRLPTVQLHLTGKFRPSESQLTTFDFSESNVRAT